MHAYWNAFLLGIYYRPSKRSLQRLCFHRCLSLHGWADVCSIACWDSPPEQTPPRQQTPPEQTPTHPSRADTPSGADTPTEQPPLQSRHPPEQTPPRADTHPWEQTPPKANTPLCSACWEIRATSGRYASYWNAGTCSKKFLHGPPSGKPFVITSNRLVDNNYCKQ